MKHLLRAMTLAIAFLASLAFAPAQAQTIKLAYTDPLSGPFAQVGDANLKMWQYLIDYINSKGGALGRKFELVPFDNKSQPADALLALKSATDQNMPFIVQCSGSNIAAALIDAVEKHNARNPDNRIIYINCGAVATELSRVVPTLFEAIQRPGAIQAAVQYYRTAVARGLLRAKEFQRYPRIEAPAHLLWGLEDRWLDFETLVPGIRFTVAQPDSEQAASTKGSRPTRSTHADARR